MIKKKERKNERNKEGKIEHMYFAKYRKVLKMRLSQNLGANTVVLKFLLPQKTTIRTLR